MKMLLNQRLRNGGLPARGPNKTPFVLNIKYNLGSKMIQWPNFIGQPVLGEGEIHIWAASLNIGSDRLAIFEADLSKDERFRAKQFKFQQLQRKFIAGRGMLRVILGQYLHVKAAEVNFAYGPYGKPELLSVNDFPRIHFNLAHSEDMVLIAVTRVGFVGVDLERIRVIEEVGELVARFFSAQETELFCKLSSGQKDIGFFNLWTRKEAFLKATGEGITRSLNLVEVTFVPGESARFIAISGDTDRASEWSLHELRPALGYSGAVAIQSKDISIRCWKWPPIFT